MLSRVVVTLFYFIWCSRCIHTDTLILSRLLNIQLFLIVWNNPSDRFGGRERDTNSPCSCFCAYTFSILLWFISYAIHNPHQAHWFRRNARHCNHFLSLACAIFFSASVFSFYQQLQRLYMYNTYDVKCDACFSFRTICFSVNAHKVICSWKRGGKHGKSVNVKTAFAKWSLWKWTGYYMR